MSTWLGGGGLDCWIGVSANQAFSYSSIVEVIKPNVYLICYVFRIGSPKTRIASNC